MVFADGIEQDFIAFDWGRRVELGPAARSCGSTSSSREGAAVQAVGSAAIAPQLRKGKARS